MGELLVGLTEYFAFYNGQRPHQSLGQQTPDVVYRSAVGGGAIIVDWGVHLTKVKRKLGRWNAPAPAPTIPSPSGSSSHGSGLMLTAWTTWNG
jgi:hypothetical protein